MQVVTHATEAAKIVAPETTRRPNIPFVPPPGWELPWQPPGKEAEQEEHEEATEE